MAARVLIIEDEEKIARFLELELTHEGYEADKAGNGRLGLDMALEGGYDIILLDLMLPELSGLEVIRRLRKSSDVPVIVPFPVYQTPRSKKKQNNPQDISM